MMKKYLLVCLLAAGPAVFAQGSAASSDDQRRKETAEASKVQADEAKKRAELEAARARLDKAAREVAELSTDLSSDSRHINTFVFTGDRRSVLGVQVDPESGKDGARVRGVSPGGPAAEAGLQTGDVIVALDGKAVAGGENAGRALIEQMRSVKPEQKVKVRVLRSGKNKDLIVVARPIIIRDSRFETMPDMGGPMGGVTSAMPVLQRLRTIWPGEFGGMELASITPKLGAYFGATSGVLVVQAPDNAVFKLEDGDVIQSIDGRKPDDGTHALRILRSYQAGEKVNLSVLRQRKPLTLAITMPERPEIGEQFLMDIPPMPPMALPAPGAPPAPPGPGTDE